MDLIGFLYGFGVLQSILLAGLLLFIRSGNRLANAFMAGLVVVMGLNLLQSWLIRIGFYLEHPSFGLLIPPLDFAWGPLLYLYAYSLTSRSVNWSHALHFLPTVFMLTSTWKFHTIPEEHQRNLLSYLWSQREDIQLIPAVANAIPSFWRHWIDLHLQGSFFALHFGTYCILVLRQIRNHNQLLQRHFSSLEKMNLKWLGQLTLMCLLFLLVFVVFNRSQLLLVGHFDVNALTPSAPSILQVLLIYVIAMAAIFQPSLIRGISAATLDGEESPKPSPDSVETEEKKVTESGSAPPAPQETTKYERSGLSLEDAQAFKILLMEKMQEEQLYLDCELTLLDLAKHTGLTAHQVSQVINSQMNQNFFSFVNNYRIQMAKDLMSQPETQNMPIVELAVEVGFKSKSSFYDAFKKATQMTPTQFKKSLS
ncbi:hypothetical protein R50073_19740 [Maricurvus nonylphenolicus]|uniref:helix-turn-helix domain-containing protein n=1 Tax=Maricurvus nonylphenolicus TaxID=1008307 RepID=UPI0036F2B4DC